MENIGIGGAFAGGEGQVSITLGWDDAAYAPAFDEIEGDVELSFSEGAFWRWSQGRPESWGFSLSRLCRDGCCWILRTLPRMDCVTIRSREECR